MDLLAGSVPAVGNVRQYARIVRENAMLRRLLHAAYEIQARSTPTRPRRASWWTSPSARSSRSPTRTRRKDFRSIEVVLDAETTKLAELSRAGKAITGTASGYEDLDTITGGFQPGNLIILAARPSMGKCLAGSTLVYDPRTAVGAASTSSSADVEQGRDAYVASLGPDLQDACIEGQRRPAERRSDGRTGSRHGSVARSGRHGEPPAADPPGLARSVRARSR